MAPELTALIEAGRALPVEDRYELVHQMLASVDDETSLAVPDNDNAWKAEFRRRIDDIESGRVQMVSHAETMQLARERIARRRAESLA